MPLFVVKVIGWMQCHFSSLTFFFLLVLMMCFPFSMDSKYVIGSNLVIVGCQNKYMWDFCVQLLACA